MLTRYFCAGLLLALLIGLIFGYTAGGAAAALLFGFMAGNFACSLIHRLPRNKSILANAPYCGSCAHPLSEMDLLPVIGALLLKHRCRYCGVSYPTSHTWTELLIGLLFVLAFLQYNFSDRFILAAAIGAFLVILAAIEINDGVIMGKILLCIAVFGMLNRTLVDGTLFNFFNGGLIGLLIGALLWRKQIKPAGHIYTLPKPVQLLTAGGICVGTHGLPVFLALFFITPHLLRSLARITFRIPPFGGDRPLITIAFGLAVMLPVLWPNFTMMLMR